MFTAVWLLLLFALIAEPATAQAADTSATAYVRGKVIREGGAEPVPHARITLLGWSEDAIRADAEGRFRFAVRMPGHYTLIAQSSGLILEQRSVEVSCERPGQISMAGDPPLQCPVSPGPILIRMRSLIGESALPGVVRGRVVDEATGQGIRGVQVTVGGGMQGTLSDHEGRYSIERVEPGMYWVQAFVLGFATERRLIGSTCQSEAVPCVPDGATLNFWMRKLPITLD